MHPLRPLGWVELVHRACNDAGAFQFARAFRVEGNSAAPRIRRALERVHRRERLLQARIAWRRGRPWFHWDEDMPAPVVSADAETSWQQLLERDVNAPFHDAGPLWRATLAEREGGVDLVLGFHHAVADGAAALALGQCILDDAGGSEPVEDRVVGREPLPAAEHFDYARGLLQRNASWLAWAFSRLSSRPLGKLNADGPEVGAHGRRSKAVFRKLPVPTSSRLRERCREHATSFHGALAVAWIRSFAQVMPVAPGDPLSCYTVLSLRERCQPAVASERLGAMDYWVRTEHRDRRGDFWSQAQRIGGRVRREAARGGFPPRWPILGPFVPWAMGRIGRRIAGRCWGRAETMGMANLGAVDLRTRHGDLTLRETYAATAQHGLGPWVMLHAATVDGELIVGMSFSQPPWAPERIERLADEFVRLLNEAAA